MNEIQIGDRVAFTYLGHHRTGLVLDIVTDEEDWATEWIKVDTEPKSYPIWEKREDRIFWMPLRSVTKIR